MKGFHAMLNTDQRGCYDASGREIPCCQTGQDAEMAKELEGPVCRFTSDESVVVDALTELMWIRDAGMVEFPLMWDEAHAYVQEMDAAEMYGFKGWRIPSRRELFTLVSHDTFNPVLPQGGPFINVFPGYYWTSTPCSRLQDQAWYVHFGGGRVMKGMKHGSYLVWPVRAGEAGAEKCAFEDRPPSTRYISKDSIVTDRLTGLMWSNTTGLSKTPIAWEAAFRMVKELNIREYLGFSDWRLPNIRELESLVDTDFHSPALDTGHPFKQVMDGYWSSTTSVMNPRYAWVLYTLDGAVGVGFKPESEFYIRLVRRGGDCYV
jgi:hypothetical protein